MELLVHAFAGLIVAGFITLSIVALFLMIAIWIDK